jgi:hypothetical protein
MKVKEELHRERKEVEVSTCARCGQVRQHKNGRKYLYEYYVEDSNGKDWLENYYCSNQCFNIMNPNQNKPQNEMIKPFVYPELDRDQIIDRRRELCSELEEVTAQLSGQLIESALECSRLRNVLHAALSMLETIGKEDIRYYAPLTISVIKQALEGREG